MLEGIEKHRETVEEGSATETERMHERGCENSSVACMTIAQETFESCEKFQSERAWLFSFVDESGLVFV